MKILRITAILIAIIIGISFQLSAQVDNKRPEKPTKENNRPLPPDGLLQPPPTPVLPGIPNLTKEQNESIKKLQLKISQDVLPIENEMREKEAHLNTLTSVKTPDMDAIYKVVDEIAAQKVKIAKLQIAHDMDIRKVLDDEQRLIFDRRPKHPPQ